MTWNHPDAKKKQNKKNGRTKMAQHLRLAKLTVRLYTPHDRRQYTPRRREEEGIRERKREKESERD